MLFVKTVYAIMFILFWFKGRVTINRVTVTRHDVSFIRWLVYTIIASFIATLIICIPILGVVYLIQLIF